MVEEQQLNDSHELTTFAKFFSVFDARTLSPPLPEISKACLLYGLAVGIGTRTVRAIVPYPPAGATDVIARQLANYLYGRWGHPLVIDTRAGADTVIGTALVARAPADGNALLITTDTHVVSVTLVRKLPFDPVGSFEPVSLLGTATNVLLAPLPCRHEQSRNSSHWPKPVPAASFTHRVAMGASAILR
jgi:hypothetical protein